MKVLGAPLTILPVRNFQDGTHPQADELSGQTMREKYGSKTSACKRCAISCGHKGTFKNGEVLQIPEYETVALLGSNLEIFDTDIIAKWNETCGKMGIERRDAETQRGRGAEERRSKGEFGGRLSG